MPYLVTGGTGYIGSYVVRDLLEAGKEIVCFQRSGITPAAREIVGDDKLKRVKMVQGDVSNTVQLFGAIQEHKIDIIVHTSYAAPPTSEEEPASALRTNCIGMNNMLEAVRLFGLKRLVWTSSSQAFGRLGELYQKPVGDDDALYAPSSMYGATKVLNEFMARLYGEKFGVDSIGIRLPRSYGVGRWSGAHGVFMEFYRKAALNIPVTIEDPDFTTAYLYVDDAAAVIVRACEAPRTKTRVFNVLEGMHSHREVVEAIRRVNPQAKVTLKPGTVKGFRPPLVSDSGVRTELGWQPKYSLEGGLRKVFNHFRQQEGMPLL